jgi:hypothetical protein
MNRTTTADPDASPAARPAGTRRVLCAYSPRWLSGPTPRYRGLCPTWEGDEPTAEVPAAVAAN